MIRTIIMELLLLNILFSPFIVVIITTDVVHKYIFICVTMKKPFDFVFLFTLKVCSWKINVAIV